MKKRSTIALILCLCLMLFILPVSAMSEQTDVPANCQVSSVLSSEYATSFTNAIPSTASAHPHGGVFDRYCSSCTQNKETATNTSSEEYVFWGLESADKAGAPISFIVTFDVTYSNTYNRPRAYAPMSTLPAFVSYVSSVYGDYSYKANAFVPNIFVSANSSVTYHKSSGGTLATESLTAHGGANATALGAYQLDSMPVSATASAVIQNFGSFPDSETQYVLTDF